MRKILHHIAVLFFLVLPTLLHAYSTTPEQEKLLQQADAQNVLAILNAANDYSPKDLDFALRLAAIALKKAEKNHSNREIFDVYRSYGLIYEDHTRWVDAIKYYQLAEKHADVDSTRLTIYDDLAISHRKAGFYQKSYEYHNKTLEIAQRVGDRQMMDCSYHGLGILHREAGVYDKAISYFLKSLAFSEKEGKTRDIIVSHIDLADIYLRAKETEKALIHIERAFRFSSDFQNRKKGNTEVTAQYASVLNKYGEILTARGEFTGANGKYQEALDIYKNMGYKQYVARTLMFVADVYLKQNRTNEAEKIFLEAMTYKTSLLATDFAKLYYKIGELHQKRGNVKESETYYAEALQVSMQHDFKDVAQKSNYQLFLINLERHENGRALTFLNASNALNDSLFNEEKRRRTAEVELKFDVEKRENELNALRLEQSDLQAQQSRILMIASIALFAIVVGFLGYVISSRGRNYRALQAKNEEIKQQYKRLEESNEILRQFAYVAAHDLKEPLRSIGSYISLIQLKYSKLIDENGKGYFNFVNAGVKRMYSLLTDLLDFSQVLAQQPGCEVLRPEEVMQEVADNLRSAIETRNGKVEFNQDMPSVRMHKMHLLQLFQNLVGNGLKFTEKPPVIRVEGKHDGENVLFTIQDNGVGIDPDYANKVFVLFQQLNKKFEGTGIGLTICKNIVEKYNGKIWFESNQGVGTKFYISLPVSNV